LVQDISNEEFCEQVNWEQDYLKETDIIAANTFSFDCHFGWCELITMYTKKVMHTKKREEGQSL